MAFSGHTQASTLFKHYVLPETNAVREAINRREAANPGAQFDGKKVEKQPSSVVGGRY
jgi:hypothetical protein